MTRRLGFILLAAFEEAEPGSGSRKRSGWRVVLDYLWLKHPYSEESMEGICGGLISAGLHPSSTTCWVKNRALDRLSWLSWMEAVLRGACESGVAADCRGL